MAGWLDRLTGRHNVDADTYPMGPLRAVAEALPPTSALVDEVELLALDVETTGLDAAADSVLSLGWVPVVGGEILLSKAEHVVVRPPAGVQVGDSATFHGLTDDEVAGAPVLEQILPEVLAALRGRVLVAHHAPIELGFLGRAVQRSCDGSLPALTLDTMQIQRHLVVDERGEVAPGALRLDACRRHFGLPRYRSHSALIDAVATAELVLAQVAEISHRRKSRQSLRDLGAKLTR